MPDHSNYFEMQGITKSFPGVKVLKGVSFGVREGEVHGLIGGNGAGKSTLMNILGGLYHKDEGEILIQGEPAVIRSPGDSKKYGISFVHQELKQFPYLTVAENICMSQLPTSGPFRLVDEKRKNAYARQALEQVGLSVDPTTVMEELSIADQQLIEIAKALTSNTKILILDEPTSSITDKEIKKLFEVMDSLRKRGVCIIFISHKLNEVFAICDRISVLRDGQIIGTRDIAQTNESEIVSMMIGKNLDQYYPEITVSQSTHKLLEVSHFENEKVHDVSLTLHEGEVLGIFGLVGAGRSELARAIFGLDPIQSGELKVDGKSVHFKNSRQAIAQGVAFLTENRRSEGIIPEMGIRENISLPILDRLSNFGIINRRKDRAAVEKAFGDFHIVASGPEQLIKTLSGGNQQKVVLAKWMATDVRVLILDEPTRGVDIGAKAEIYRLIADMAREAGIGVIIISSEESEILGNCHRVLVMNKGRITGEFSREEVSEEKLFACAMGGGER